MKMYEERKAFILGKLSQHGSVSSKDIARQLAVSVVTTRSDFRLLEEEGLLKRVHGGAARIQPQRYDPKFQEEIAIDVDAKQAMGETAANLVKKNDIVFVDSGSTTLFFVEKLVQTPPTNLTIVTHSLYIINCITLKPEINLVVLGGVFHYSLMNFLDFDIAQQLQRYNIHKVFLGVDGVDENGYYASNIQEANFKRSLCQTASKIFIMANPSKIGKQSLIRIREWSTQDTLITVLPDFKQHEYWISVATSKGFKLIDTYLSETHH